MPGNYPVGEYVQHELCPFGSDFLCECQPPERLGKFDVDQWRCVPFPVKHLIRCALTSRRLEEEFQRNGCIDDDHSL